MKMQAEIEREVSFVVPLTPVSVNHYTRPCKYIGRNGYLRTGKKLTPQAKAFNEAVAIFARGRTVAPATEAERRKVHYRVEVDVYLGPRQKLDADNCGKQLCDALQKAGVLHSDNYVSPFIVHLHKDDRTNPRTVYNITRLES